MRRLLTAASSVTLSLALALALFTGIALTSPAWAEEGIRCQGPPPGCIEVIQCVALECCQTHIVIIQCACACL